MNRQHRLVWSKRLRMLVAVSETARACGKSGAGEATMGRSGPATAGASAAAVNASAASWRRSLTAIAFVSLLGLPGAAAWATGLSLPAGSILDINSSAGYSSGWTNYTVGFTAQDSGNNYVLFAFRQDPAFWTFGNVSLTAAGDSTNLFTDPTFATGGTLSAQSNLQAPADWGIVYQSGTTPRAAGRWQPGFNGDTAAGAWYDGAVGSFDGIYQGVNLTAGVNYTIGFTLKGDNAASAAQGIEMGVFAGPCISLTGPVANCTPANAAFTTLATPDQTANAGHPATNIDTAAPSYLASNIPTTVNPAFDGGTLQMDASVGQGLTISTRGGTIDQAGNTSTLSGVLSNASGSASLRFTNSASGGSVTLSAVNTYTGGTTIDSGATVKLSGGGSIAASSGLADNGTFDIAGTTSGASVRTLSGNGTVNLGARTLTLTGAHDTFSGSIGGSGGVVVGGGTEVLSGTNTYGGGTTVQGGGTLQVGADANLGDAAGGVTLDAGTLHSTATFTTGRDLTMGSGGGTFDVDAGTTLTDLTGTVDGLGRLAKTGTGTLVLGGALSQAGGVALDGGTLVLGGTNTYTGGTTVSAGTLQVSADANLGAATGNPLTLNGGSLQSTATFTSGRDIAVGSNGGTVVTDAGTTLTVGGAVTGNGSLHKGGTGTLVLGGAISGSGGLVVDAGTETLTGTNTYTGTTTVNTGATLALVGGGSIASSSQLLANGTLDIAGTTGGAPVQSLAGTGTVVLGGNTLTITNGHDTFGGTIGGTGGVAIAGGTETLAGTNSYQGGTSVRTGGTLRVGADANLGDASGGLHLDGGTLESTSTFATGRDIAVGAGGGTVVTDAGTTLTNATGTVSGPGGLAKAGSGTLVLGGTLSQAGGVDVGAGTLVLAGTNGYTGGTTVHGGGTLQVGGDANLGATTSNPLTLDGGTLQTTASFGTMRDIALGTGGGTLRSDAGTTLTAGGTLSGTGALAKAGGGTLELSGTNTYTGGTSITGGTVRVGTDANLGDASGPVHLDGGTLEATNSFNTGRDLTVGSGGGTIATAAGVTVTDSTGNVTGTGGLTTTGAGTLALGGSLSQGGGVHVDGGTLVLSGSNSYTGGTTVVGSGTLQVSADNQLGATVGNPLVLDGGTLHGTAVIATGRDITLGGNGGRVTADAGTTFTSGGAIAGTGTLVKDGAGTLSVGGTLSQAGGVVVSGGTLAMAGTNSYTGGTTVNSGATVQVGADANLGATSGNPLALNGGTLATTASFSTARDLALGSGGGTVATAAGTTLAESGVISGTAGLTKTGAGTLALTGSNAYTGATTIGEGTLALAGSGSIAASSGVQADGTFDISGTTAGAAVRTLSGAGGVTLGNQNLSLTQASGTFAGSIGGAGSLAVLGGTETLSGSNTYTGGTLVTGAGTLRVGADANLGAATGPLWLDNGTLQATSSFETARTMNLGTGGGHVDVAAGSTLTGTGNVTGSGGLVKNGTGTLVLGGTLAQSGGTTVNSGVLQLSGTNHYTGGTTLNGGTLQVASDANLGAASSGVTLNGGTLQATATFSTDRAVTVTAAGGTLRPEGSSTLVVNGSIAGSGALTKEGSGTLILSGDNAGADHAPGTGWTGGITVNGGLVQVTNAWGLGWGNVNVNGGTINTLVDIRTGQTIAVAPGSSIDTATGTVTTLSGNLASSSAGGGCFVKTGTGTLNIAGTAVLGNGTCVEQGTLRANGTLTSNVRVDAGATLGGAGTIHGNVAVRGTLSPGNSPGYLTATGTVTMAAGSTYQEDIAGATAATSSTPTGSAGVYSVLHVTGTGQFAIDPASTLAPRLQNLFSAGEPGAGSPAYKPALGQSFRIVTADGGLQGRFGTLVQPEGLADGMRFAAFYNTDSSNSIDLVVLPTSYASWLAGSNGNTRSVAGALDTVLARDQAGLATAAQDKLLALVARQDAQSLPGYVQALAGEVHGAMAAAASQQGLALQDTVGRQLGWSSAAADGSDVRAANGLWIDLKAQHANWRGDDASAGFTTDGSRVTLGGDLLRHGDTRFGVGLAHADTRVHAAGGSGTLGENTAFVYAQHGLAGFLVDGIAAHGRSTQDTQRGDPTAASTSLSSTAHGRSTLVSAGVRAPWTLGEARLSPFARATVHKAERGATSEGMDSPAALDLARWSQTGTRLTAGVAGASAQTDPLRTRFTWQYSAALGVDGGSLVRPVVDARLAGMQTSVGAPQVGRLFTQLAASATVRLQRLTYAYVGLGGEAREGKTSASVNAGLRAAF